MRSLRRIALVFAVALALAGGAASTVPGSASAQDVSAAGPTYYSGGMLCGSSITLVSHASGTVYHRVNGLPVAVFNNGMSFEHDSSTTPVQYSFHTWEVESVGGYIFKANARCD